MRVLVAAPVPMIPQQEARSKARWCCEAGTVVLRDRPQLQKPVLKQCCLCCRRATRYPKQGAGDQQDAGKPYLVVLICLAQMLCRSMCVHSSSQQRMLSFASLAGNHAALLSSDIMQARDRCRCPAHSTAPFRLLGHRLSPSSACSSISSLLSGRITLLQVF